VALLPLLSLLLPLLLLLVLILPLRLRHGLRERQLLRLTERLRLGRARWSFRHFEHRARRRGARHAGRERRECLAAGGDVLNLLARLRVLQHRHRHGQRLRLRIGRRRRRRREQG